jgi:transposase-like protein
VLGVSTRKVDDLVQALGLSGVDKSKVSRICQELDSVVIDFRQRPLTGDHPYVWLDALYLKVRQHHRVVSQAVVIAVGVNRRGERALLGFDSGAGEDGVFSAFSTQPGTAWLAGDATGHQRRPPRLEGGR